MSELIWISVPDGLSADGSLARMRVMISPRLTVTDLAAATMAQWPPAALSSGALRVDFTDDTGSTLTSIDIAAPHIRAQDGVWEKFFGPRTIVKPVAPRGAMATRQPVDVEPTTDVAASVDATYVAVASAGVDAEASVHPELDTVVQTQLQTHWSGQQTRSSTRSPAPTTTLPPEPPDFHRTLAMLREHPNVLTALGLVFEISFPRASLPEGFSNPRLRVRPAAVVEGLPEIGSPWTLYGTDFHPRSSETISGGMVTLIDDRDLNRDTGWRTVTFDVENGAERLRQAAAKTARAAAGAEKSEMPALRSAGILLLKRGRKADFAARAQTATNNASRSRSSDMVLNADDLINGYRIDVKDRTGGTWQSLHRRQATYTVGEPGAEILLAGAAFEEEGHVKPHAAVDDGSGVLRANEVVTRWDGWSLSAPRPAFDGSDRPERAARAMSNTTSRFSFHFDAVAGSLPSLRFGTSYSVRARVAYLGGGGLQLGDVSADRCFVDQVYQRYDPILSPEVRTLADAPPFGPSETTKEIVIRSDREQTHAAFAAAHPQYQDNFKREMAPPRAALTMAEHHGALNGTDPEAIWAQIQEVIVTDPGRGDAEPPLPDVAAQGVMVFTRREPGGVSAPRIHRAWEGTWPKLTSRQMELRERTPADPAAVFWEGMAGGPERLVVSLKAGEQVTLELSSYPDSHKVDEFAVQQAAGVTGNAFTDGRHPLATPAAPVVFTHAVRKPLKDPAGALSAVRGPAETFTTLTAAPGLLDIDANSTAQMDLRASWTEVFDTMSTPQTSIPVQSVLIGRGDQVFGVPLRHEFSDTRHRRVTYEATAISRYRRYFDAADPSEAFRTDSIVLPQSVSIPNSGRPSAPVVVSTTPAFIWEETRSEDGAQIVRRRVGGTLRVELARPWLETGEGELLAVVVADDAAEPRQDKQQYLTRVGRDPIWWTGATEILPQWPDETALSGAAGDAVSVGLEETRTATLIPDVMTDPPESKTIESLQSVRVVPFAPWFANGRWYADITLRGLAQVSYAPFVRLALARYQPESVVRVGNSVPTPPTQPADVRLSSIVHSEMVQLPPERELTIERSSDAVSVRLAGLGPSVPRRNRIDVLLEHADGIASELTAVGAVPDGVSAWRAMATSQIELGGPATSFALPDGAGGMRLRVREVELIGGETASFPVQAGQPGELSERVIYVDVVPLD